MGLFDLSKKSEERLGAFFEVDLKKKVKEAEDKFRTIFHSTSDAIIFLDNKDSIVDVNNKMVEMFGFGRVHLIGKRLSELPELIDANSLKRLLGAKAKSHTYEMILAKSSGGSIHVDVNVISMKQKGKTVGEAVILRDASYRKKIESMKLKSKKEQQTRRIRSNFLMRVSHELRHPLFPIVGYANTLLEDKSLTKKQKGYLEKILDNSKRLTELIDKMLYVTALETGEITVNFNNIQVSLLINEVLKRFEEEARDKKIRIIKDFGSEPKIMIDYSMMEQALINLVRNSFDNTSKGSVAVKISEDSSHYKISIIDTGKGMSRTEVDKLVKGVSYLDETDKLYTGFNLGFTVAELVTKLHNGELKVQSSPGRGTSVSILLPKKRQ